MSIKKQYLKSKPKCKVTFRLPPKAAKNAKAVNIVGEFNNWSKKATPMKRLKSGAYVATLDLDPGREYQYRYLIDQNEWENDWHADKYISSFFGGCENSVIVV
ncbi:MAG: isoamylase early set domain-containing protein [Deltaproteobacteria bacterium]|nr:isoamylase early set domain-containing protein [Deltaproteobacteria bacterium]